MIACRLFSLRTPKNMMAEDGRRMSVVCALLKNSAKVPKCHWDIIVYAFQICGSERPIAIPPSEILDSPIKCQNSAKMGFPATMKMMSQVIIALFWQSKLYYSASEMLLSTVSVTGLANVIQYSYTWTLNLVNRIAASAKSISWQQGGLLMPWEFSDRPLRLQWIVWLYRPVYTSCWGCSSIVEHQGLLFKNA